MKKRTKKILSNDIMSRIKMNIRLIEDINLIKKEASNLQLQGNIKKIILDIIGIYNNQLKEINEYPIINTGKFNCSLKSINIDYNFEKYLMNNFKKNELLKIDARASEDMIILSEYQDELLKGMDKVHKEISRRKEYSSYNLYHVNTSQWIDGGNFNSMDEALKEIEKSKTLKLKTGHKYFIISPDKKAFFDYTLSCEIENVEIISLRNNIKLTCETYLINIGWIHTTYETDDYKINDLLINLRTNKNIRNISEPEIIIAKEYKYTYTDCDLGQMPRDGLLRIEKNEKARFDTLVYNRELKNHELKHFGIKLINN